jgi:catechol 2,3-dioxygenase-like lactoylglutathione lyase family enzyme
MQKGRVTGIGGVFLKSKDQAGLSSWYADRLGIGPMFQWRSFENPQVEQVTAWSVFPEDSKYFDPSTAPFMINYVVDDLDALLEKLREAGVRIDPKREDGEYGRFAWIFDPDGNKIELWEPATPG